MAATTGPIPAIFQSEAVSHQIKTDGVFDTHIGDQTGEVLVAPVITGSIPKHPASIRAVARVRSAPRSPRTTVRAVTETSRSPLVLAFLCSRKPPRIIDRCGGERLLLR